jgi:hypothetical protein
MFAHSLWPWLQTVLSYRSASLTCIIFIPGTLGLILGGIQWYMIGGAVVWYRRRRERVAAINHNEANAQIAVKVSFKNAAAESGSLIPLSGPPG